MYDERLALRIRKIVEEQNTSERKMFGGIAFLDRGHMFCGIIEDDLMVRVGPDHYEGALAQPNVRQMTFTGRPMRGLVYVAAAGVRTEKSLRHWVGQGLRFTRSLPDKKKAPRAPRPRRRA